MGKRNKFEGFRNTATFSLNGKNHEVQRNHLEFIGYLRAWCYQQGRRADVSGLFDRECVIYTTPERGTFYPVITYQGRSLVFVIDGRNLYIKGFSGPNGSYQLSLDEQEVNYMLQDDLEILDFHANYHDITPGHDVGHTLMGLHSLRKAFDCLWAHKGGKPDPKFRGSIVMISVYISEAARFQPVLDCASTSLVDDNISRLNKMSQISEVVTSWRFLSRQVMTHINYLMAGQTPPEFDNRGISRYSSIEDLFPEVRILFRDANPTVPSMNADQCPFRDEDPLQYPVFASPVDPGLGDPKIDVSFMKPGVQSLCSINSQSGRKRQNEYQYQKRGRKRQNEHQYQKNSRRKKPALDLEDAIQAARRKFYMGGGVGGPVSNVPQFFIEPWAPKLTASKERKKPSSSSDATIDSPKSAKRPIASVKTSPFSSGQKRNLSYSSSPVCTNGAKACEFQSGIRAIDSCEMISRTQKLKMSQGQITSLSVPRTGAPSGLNSDIGSLFPLRASKLVSVKEHLKLLNCSTIRKDVNMCNLQFGANAMNMQWERHDSWFRKMKMRQEWFTPSPCKPKVSHGQFSMTVPHACGERMGMGSVCNFQVRARTLPWKMDCLDTGQLVRSNRCNVLKWYNDNRHGTAYNGHAKMVAAPKSFLQNIKPRCSWIFSRVARLLH